MRKKLIVICSLVLFLLLAVGVYALYRHQNTSSARPENRYTGTIAQFHSTIDQDGDGNDDQQEMLQGALEYVAQKPKYKSEYYQTGYPDDGYGVCTDVVAYACRSAGYDLMQLVNEDILADPEAYGITEPDINIDFRRVKNLKVYFSRHAVSLTTDVNDIEAWQGGDIIIFEKHIGIISDKRNADGVPYVIHHNDPMQISYEQDILEKRSDIVGHYRISE